MSCCVQTEHVLQSVPMNLAAGESRQVKQEFQAENVQAFFREGGIFFLNFGAAYFFGMGDFSLLILKEFFGG